MSVQALERYRNDAPFAAAVNLLTNMALEHRFTAGELRDIAYVAAVRVEQKTTRTFFPVPETWGPEEIRKVQP